MGMLPSFISSKTWTNQDMLRLFMFIYWLDRLDSFIDFCSCYDDHTLLFN